MLGLLRRLWGSDPVPAGVLRPARDVLTAERDGVAVLLDLRREVYLGLDDVGTTAWRCIERGATAEDITLTLCAEYDAPEAVVRADAERFIADLQKRRLVISA